MARSIAELKDLALTAVEAKNVEMIEVARLWKRNADGGRSGLGWPSDE
jgi:hypothetical protein